MRRILLTYILLVVGLLTAQAQFNPTQQVDPRTGRDANGNQIDPAMRVQEDSTDVEIQGLPPTLYMWHVSENLGTIQRIPADTATHMFQNTNLVEGLTGHYNYLGNLGSPRLSLLFFESRDAEPTIFMEPFSSFFIRPDEFNFTNSNVPFTNLTYYKAGNKINGEERFKSYFSVNVNKRLAFGFNFDYLYGRGYYNNQNTSYFNAALFGSYIGDRYEATLLYSNNYLKMNENGGITDDRYITRPEEMADRYYAVASVPNGMYALIDYVNFKGEGTNPAEQYRGIGWGLRQVLEEMRPVSPGQPAAVEFAEAAKRVLQRRVDNSPPGRGEARWLAGWRNRCDSYKRNL